MNIQRMEIAASKLISEWESNRMSPDLVGSADFTRGVIFGLKTMFTLVQHHVHAPLSDWRLRRVVLRKDLP